LFDWEICKSFLNGMDYLFIPALSDKFRVVGLYPWLHINGNIIKLVLPLILKFVLCAISLDGRFDFNCIF